MYSFEIEGHDARKLVLFSSHLEGGEIFYSLEVEGLLKEYSSKFDSVLFICPEHCHLKIMEWLSCEDSRLLSNLQRGDDDQSVLIIGFDEFARLEVLSQFGRRYDLNDQALCDIFSFGLRNLLCANGDQVFLIAPAGTVFKKPSGKTSRLFIKTSEMAVGCSQIRFVALSLLRFRPSIIENIYVDTSGISIYIEAMIAMLAAFDSKYLMLNYSSFKSYSGLDGDSLPPASSGAWYIISASLSNDMGKRIAEKVVDASFEQILTILSPVRSAEGEPGSQVLLDISSHEKYLELRMEESPIMELEVRGENFYVPVMDPREVVLKGIDKPQSIENMIEYYKECDFLSFNVYSKSRYRNYSLNFNKIVSNEAFYQKFEEWVRYFVNWRLPVSVRSVIIDNTDVGAEDILNVIEQAAGFLFERYSFDDLSGLSGDKGVLIVTPVLSTGKRFSKLNSDLRLVNHAGARTFVSPFATFSDSQSFETFKRRLCYGPKGMKYTFDSFRTIFLGDLKHSIWKREEEFLQGRNPIAWKNRLAELADKDGSAFKNVGLLRDGESNGFTTDFAFWKGGYDPINSNPAAVLWSIAALLQAVREFNLDPKKRDRSLYHNVNQYSVLDPENFSRFNDPLIQSCLWRSAYSHELNYGTSVRLSMKFFDVISKQVSEYVRGVKNGALDLLLAIAMRHIVLDSTTSEKLKKFLADQDCNCPRFCDLVLIISGDNSDHGYEF
jgi:hypothetical protein